MSFNKDPMGSLFSSEKLDTYVKKIVNPCEHILKDEKINENKKLYILVDLLNKKYDSLTRQTINDIIDINTFLYLEYLESDSILTQAVRCAYQNKKIEEVSHQYSKKEYSKHEEAFDAIAKAYVYDAMRKRKEQEIENQRKRIQANKNIKEVFSYAQDALNKMLAKAKEQKSDDEMQK